jgi:signal transduction histidine kinase
MCSRKRSGQGPLDEGELFLVLEAMPQAVACFDADGRLLYLNAAGRRWLQREGPELETALLSDLISEPGAERLLREALPEAARTGRWEGRGDLLPRRGTPIPVILGLLSHPPEEGRKLVFTLIASPVKEAFDDRDPSLAASLGFLHDLNNLLGPVIAYAALGQERVERDSPVFRYLGQILTAGERARALAERLLQRIHPASNASRLVVLADLVEEVVTWLRVEHPGHEFQIDSPLSRSGIRGDAAGLQQMVLNLCKNAVESLPPSGGGKVSVSVRDVEGRRELRFTVRDNGCGMEEAVLGRIFEPFFSTKAGGTGVGLSITREVVRRHRGTMSIESTFGAGTAFHVQLPVDGPAPA